ncbi:hypothetical protein HON59_00875 [bacterium]|nr:hypothetical protein [bacterium]MBT3730185.1 hypothetical protein [bacterium]MBT4894605.1 hypothetical protein [bacterium]
MAAIQNLFASSTGGTLETVMNLSLDTIILIVIFLVFFIYGLKFGKRRIISLMLSLYASVPVVFFFPYLQSISFFGETEKAILYSQIGLFILVIILINVLLTGIVSFELYHRGLRKLIENGFLALASGGLLVAISYHIINISDLYDFAGIVDTLFASTTLFFWWLVAPLIVIFFTTRK